eukprot:Phypoly_transcript_00578.p1 GENE.Phypoly_transcript_00578~~Phypoly_transcript_00578.p1  ORF type:complete len:1233 (-),score=182.25 Phypoly_transcript_00578:64-3762(-)
MVREIRSVEGMVQYTIRGVKVDFPYNAYESQLIYMEKVIQALQEGKNALLESPTGTGKTLCLLCATLAWRQSYLEHHKVVVGQDSSQMNPFPSGSPPPPQDMMMIPKIIYSSRTHSQLTQVVRELKRTSYKIKSSILGARDKMCIHPTVSNMKGKAQDYMCRSMVSTRKCQFYHSVSQFKSNVISDTICDIEDMVKLGLKYEVCPYYLSKEIQSSADIVFMPYNYLVDPEVRKNLSVSLHDSVLIFDEAHNLEGICGDAASFDFSSAELAACVREVQHGIDTTLRPGYGGGLNSGSGDGVSADELAQLKTVLLKLGEAVDSIKFDGGSNGFTRDGAYIYTLLGGIGINFDTHELIVKLIDDVVAMISDESEGVGIHSTIALSQFNSYLKVLFKFPLSHLDHPSQYYKVHIHADKNASQGASSSLFTGKANKRAGKEGRTLSYWCFNPGVAMQALQQSGIRSIILTSGTLSPMDSFAYELKTSFPVQLENSHVITNGQVWVGVVGKGPSGQPLNSSYQNRDNTVYKSDLGNAIVNYARIVPNGLLVFFPSYSALNSALEFWKLPIANSATTIWERICSHKQPVIEPRNSQEFPLAIEDFYQKVKDPGKEGGGAIFFAVCRGKVSEGLDFADQNGRAVIITGLPYPAKEDPKIKLKREYLDACKPPPGNTYVLRSQEWYTQQASRAINQAVGRVIRHRHDYGAIILCDERFAQRSAQDQLSKWLRPHIKVYNQFGESMVSLISFFRSANHVTPPTPSNSTDKNPSVNPVNGNGATPGFPNPSASLTTPTTEIKPTPPAAKTSSLLNTLTKANESAFAQDKNSSSAAKPPPLLSSYSKLSDQLMANRRGGNSKQFVPPVKKENKSATNTLPTNTTQSKKPVTSIKDFTNKLNSTTNKQFSNKPSPLPSPSSITPTTSTIISTANVEKQNSASLFNSLAKQQLSAENYAKFHAILRDLKTKKISLDSVVQQVRDLAPNNTELLEKFIPFIPIKHQEKYRPFLLHGAELPRPATSHQNNINSSNPNSFAADTSNNPSKPEKHDQGKGQIKKRDIQNVENNQIKKNDKDESENENKSKRKLYDDNINGNEDENEDEQNLLKNPQGALLDPHNSISESPKRVQQYDLISGQPARKKVKIASRSSLLTNLVNKEDADPTIPDPEVPLQSNVPLNVAVIPEPVISGCVCSICHAKATAPFNARCGHICCHACWTQWLQEKLECPVCREKTRPKQLTKLYFM